MPSTKKLLTATAGGDKLFVEDVFSTFVYDSTHGTSPIVNGINLADEGGLVWFKHRTSTYSNILFDTERGTSNHLVSNTTAANATSIGLGSFNTNGFSFSGVNLNVNSDSHVAWSFRKAEGFCDIVTYTGNGVTGRNISHALSSSPKMMIVKRTDNTSAWWTWHTGIGTNYISLQSTSPQAGGGIVWNNTAPTSTVFTVADDANTNGGTFVAYLFGEDAIFGEDGDEQICKMGTYTGNGNNTGPSITLGFEPQWLLIKRSSAGGNTEWVIADNMRGMPITTSANVLFPNSSNAESTGVGQIHPTATGFNIRQTTGSDLNANGETYIYMAIRRPMKVPEAGTEVFITNATSGVTNLSAGQFVTGFPVDLNINGKTTGTTKYVLDRLRGNGAYLATTATGVAATPSSTLMFNNSDASTVVELYTNWWGASSGIISWSFKRAPKFMDTICYTGNGTGGATQAHNLTVVPELIMFKNTVGTGTGWISYWSTLGLGYYILGFHSTAGIGTGSLLNNTAPTASIITLSPELWNTNNNGEEYVAYLFATLAGVSKVGSYTGTGTGTTVDVDCGFSNGARLIIIKRTDSAGDWFIYDSVRGIVSGDDPYLLLNTTAAQVNTDYIDPLSSGFTVTTDAAVTSTLNVNNANYVFLAIA